MKPLRFKSETTPWRVMVPAGKSPTGKRRAYYFENKKDALACCRDAKNGQLLPAPIPKAQEDEFGIAIRRFSKLFDGDVAKLYESAERIKKIQTLKPGTVREVITAFQTDRKNDRKTSLSTWNTNRPHLLKLERAYENKPIIEITDDLARDLLDSVSGDRSSIGKTWRKFFNWAKERNYILASPMANIKLESFGSKKGLYRVEEFQKMLRIAAGLEAPRKDTEPTKDFLPLLPWFVLSGFCGLRSHEAVRIDQTRDALKWNDLYFDEKSPFIHIRSEVAKHTPRRDRNFERRVFTSLYVGAARAWLELLDWGPSQFVVPITKRTLQEYKRKWKKATGLRFTHNGLRNSFASYALAVEDVKGIGHLAIEMGNSEATCKDFYVTNLVPRIGEAWFEIRPTPANVIQPTPTNVIPIAAAV